MAKDDFVEINGKGYDNFEDALNALRDAWSEHKAPAVAEQLEEAKAKGKPKEEAKKEE